MALRNQPYLPLYVQDFLSDEKLRECSAESIGVYIFLMCVLHKSDDYGSLTLSPKYFASDLLIGFAEMLSKHMPFSQQIIDHSLRELVAEKVINIEESRLFQKRMVRDGEISQMRAVAGGTGGKKSRKTSKNKQNVSKNKQTVSKASSKALANTEYEDENEDIDNRVKTQDSVDTENKIPTKKTRKKKESITIPEEHITAITELWNKQVKSMPKVKSLPPERIKLITELFKTVGNLDDIGYGFHKAEQSDYLTGRKSGTTWRADFEWIIKIDHWTRLVEGSFDNNGQQKGETSATLTRYPPVRQSRAVQGNRLAEEQQMAGEPFTFPDIPERQEE